QPVLERQRGMAGRVVLDPEVRDAEALAEAESGKQGSEAGAVADGRLGVERKQLAISPEVTGARSDRLRGEGAADLVEVVDRLEAAPASGASGHRVLGLLLPALLASQPDHSAHCSSAALQKKTPSTVAGGLPAALATLARGPPPPANGHSPHGWLGAADHRKAHGRKNRPRMEGGQGHPPGLVRHSGARVAGRP